MYDPSIGRWLTEDPLGFDAGDANPYRYVHNNATNATDPSGEIVIFLHGIRDDGNWIPGLYQQMVTAWRNNKQDEQLGIRVRWRGAVLAMPTVLNAHSRVWSTNADPINQDVRDRLGKLIFEVRGIIPPQCAEPVNFLGHSQGTMIALSALRLGARLDNAVFLNSPLHIHKGAEDLADAKPQAGRMSHYWSADDGAVTLINMGFPVINVGGMNMAIKNASAYLSQHQISGGHGDSTAAQYAPLYAAEVQSSGGSNLRTNPLFITQLTKLLDKDMELLFP